MAGPRPVRVGNYDLLEDFETAEATVRVLQMARTGQAIDQHVHERSTQIYVALQGRIRVEVDGAVRELAPYQATTIPAGSAHGAGPIGETAVLMNISIPPLRADDQLPVPRFEPAEAG